MAESRIVTVRLTEEQIDDIAGLGGGNFSVGLRTLHAMRFGATEPQVDGRTMAARRAPPPVPVRVVAPPPAPPAPKPLRYTPPPRGYVGKR